MERNESFFWFRFTTPDTRKAETERTPVQDLPGPERVQDQPGKLSEALFQKLKRAGLELSDRVVT